MSSDAAAYRSRASTTLLRSPARILATADRLFYAEGIHSVGVNRLVEESAVTRVTFYRHFPSKDDLIAGYLEDRAGRALAAAVSLGLALGCEMDMIGFLATRYFGLRRFGELYGYLFAVLAAGSALGPLLMGVAFDRFGSYNPLLAVFVVALALAAGLVSRLGRYAFPPCAPVASGDFSAPEGQALG